MMINSLRSLKRVPVIGPAITTALRFVRQSSFKGSADYWDSRYRKGGNSGAGSYGRLAEFKAAVINDIVAENGIKSVIEFGCGDGHQLELANYGNYIGFDVSSKAIDLCRVRFPNKPQFKFALTSDYAGETADLAMSLDVIYHLVEDGVFHNYMQLLFDSSTQFVLLYSCNAEMPQFNSAHVKTREFSDWIKRHRPDWQLVKHLPNKFPYDIGNPGDTSFADFYLYRRQSVPQT